jgi:hypothetical protein
MSKPPKSTIDAPASITPAWITPGVSRRTARIDIDDTPGNAVLKLVHGDRAAAEACIAMVKAVKTADPQAEFGPFTPLLILEAIGLVGPAIGSVYTHVCSGDPVIALAVLHAVRLKLITAATLRSAALGRTRINAPALLDLIRHKIPSFGR